MNLEPCAAAIVGVGATGYYPRGMSVPLTPLGMAATAVAAALEDAGLSIGDLDGFSLYAGGLNTSLLAQQLGMRDVRFTAALPGGGGGSAGAIGLAAAAINAGAAHVVATVLVLQQANYRLGQAAVGTASPYASALDSESDFRVPYGVVAPAHRFAMAAQRHMHLFGTTRQHFAEVAMSTRANAARRASAIRREPLTEQGYFASRMIADPLCLYDFCLETDGAVAVITTGARRARDLRHKPVHIAAAAMGGPAQYSPLLGWANAPDEYLASSFSRTIALELYARSGLQPNDVDVALLYDHFSPMVLFQLEDYGFCERGESGQFVADGNIRWPSGRLPVNTHGGHLSEAYLMGMTHVRESVEQLRGEAVNQVRNAKVALVTGGPSAIPMSAVLLQVDG